MPQTVKKITNEYAKTYYGFVINPALPFKIHSYKDDFEEQKPIESETTQKKSPTPKATKAPEF